ncbi:hypothetical protein MKW92_043489 [Papaver armeniacum]|nr:hypothetical protein MKW92_043489 [Papaver armeniacum]
MAALCSGTCIHVPKITKIHSRQRNLNGILCEARKSLERICFSITTDRSEKLSVSRWSMWKTRKCRFSVTVSNLITVPYAVRSTVLTITAPNRTVCSLRGEEEYMSFVAGDLIRYHKWFEADLWFNTPYQELMVMTKLFSSFSGIILHFLASV